MFILRMESLRVKIFFLLAIVSSVVSGGNLGFGNLYQANPAIDSSEHGGEEGDKSTTCPCGWANKVSSRIVNGVVTGRNEFPFVAGLTKIGTRVRFCGATIITKYHALTAAHCTLNVPAPQVSLLVGVQNINKDFKGPVDEIPIERIVNHPEYDIRSIKVDIALLVLKNEVKFSQLVGPACLPPTQPKLELLNQQVTVIGWGASRDRGAQSSELMKANMVVIDLRMCKREFPFMDITNSTQLCTQARAKSACQGDSGGPFVWVDPETNRYTLVGIVSFGRACNPDKPSVQTNVQYYINWIHNEIAKSNKPNAQTCSKIN